eukprot:642367-Rhodomonas_salina.2
MMTLAAGGCSTIHSLDIMQACIQSEWQYLPEGNPSSIFITVNPPDCVEEEEGIVSEVVKPLYGIPNSACALHFTGTLDYFMKSQGFIAAGFEDLVWVCYPNNTYPKQLIDSVHINDLLVSCADMATLNKFKAAFLALFDGTDDGLLTEYLGCKVVIDAAGNLTLCQSAYAESILRTYEALAWVFHSVKTLLQQGEQLTKKDSPELVNPTLHRCYCGFVSHLSFLVQMTRPDLVLAFSKLSKFVQSQGQAHWKAALRTLQYLLGTYDKGITYSYPGQQR